MRNYSPNIDRRCVFCSVAALALNVLLAKLPFGIEHTSKMVAANDGFLIVNGWVLTREDVEASEITPNVI
jgi:hypothetical protein